MNRYSSVAVFLHWSMAIAIIALLASGWSLHFEVWDSKQFTFQLFQWHKSIGVVVLCLIVLRIAWRYWHKPPQLPPAMAGEHDRLIHLGHIGLYLLLVLMPLSGWILVSTNPQGIPTIVFGILDWLHLPLPDIAYQPAKLIHYYAAWVLLVMVAGHVGMAIKHQLAGVAILQRMQAGRWLIACLLLTLVTVGVLSIPVFQSEQSRNQTVATATGSSDGLAQANRITFSGEHAGDVFSGTFDQWQLDTDLNFKQQTMSRFYLDVQTDTANTGSNLYNNTLKEEDWFDVENFPSAIFQAESVEFVTRQQALVTGELTIKRNTIPLTLTLEFDGQYITTDFTLQRQAIGLGQDADPDADWVSEEIKISAQAAL